MATTLNLNPSSSSSSSVLGIPSKLHRFLFVSLALLVVFLALAISSSAQASDLASNNQYSYKTLLFSDPPAEKNGAETLDFQPSWKMGSTHRHHQRPYHYKSKEKSEFEASKHEVPSGPNPIQN